jgi:hypothetical protein
VVLEQNHIAPQGQSYNPFFHKTIDGNTEWVHNKHIFSKGGAIWISQHAKTIVFRIIITAKMAATL